MIDGDFGAIQHKLEAEANAGAGESEPYLISIAVSLKRIADALEDVVDRTKGQPAAVRTYQVPV